MGSRATKLLTIAFGAIAGALPLGLALVYLRREDGVEAACDEGVVRVLGLGYTGVLRGLDALVTSRGSIASAVLVGVATFVVAKRLVQTLAPGALGLALALAASVLASTTYPAQLEAVLVSGNALGALLVFAPLALVMEGAPLALVFAALSLALTYDFAIAACAIAGLATSMALSRAKPRPRDALGFAVGAIPIAWMVWRRNVAAEVSLDAGALASPLGEDAVAAPRTVALAIAHAELGVIALAFAAVGVFVVMRSRVTRPAASGLVAIAVVGAAACAVGAPAGPERFSGALIAALAATSVLAACGMAIVASWVANAKIPFARASATMIVLLEIAVPVRVADDATLAMSKRDASATARWNARVFGELPRDAVLLLPTPRLFLRARAAHATGALRDDVLVLPTFGLGSRATSLAIAREPLVSPLVRDLALYGAPEEFTLSQLAAARPTLIAFDPRWDKRFARHIVPEHAFDHYFVEPRGAPERLKAFAQLDLHESSARLALATRDLLRARAMGAAATGEREWADATTLELRRTNPLDPIGMELSRRIAQTRGPVDVVDLAGRLSK